MENKNNSFNQNNNTQYNNYVPNSNTTKKKSKTPIIIVIVLISLLLLGCLVIGVIFFGVYIFNNTTSNKIQASINSINSFNNEISNTSIKNTTTGNNISSSKDKVSNHNWKGSDNSYLELNGDGTFTWYQNKNVKNDNYYTGSYTIKTGSSAIAEISDYTTINYTQLFTNKNININNYYYMNLSVTSRIIDGEERLTGGTDETHYMFYLYEGTTDTLDGVNLKSMNNVHFTIDD